MATEKPPASTSYQTEKNLANLTSGDSTSALSSVDTLSGLNLFGYLASGSIIGKDSIRQCINTMTRYFRTALHALQKVPALRNKFGEGLGAALPLASVLREKYSEKTYDAIISQAITGAGKLNGL